MRALFTNDWNSLTCTRLTIKSDDYEEFVNPEDRFSRRSILDSKLLQIYLYIYESLMNEALCVYWMNQKDLLDLYHGALVGFYF